LFEQLSQGRSNNIIIGKIALISLVKNESSKIPFLIGNFLEKLLVSDYYIDKYPIDIFDIGYDLLFCAIGSFYSHISIGVNNYPTKKHAILYDLAGYGHNVDHIIDRFSTQYIIYKYSNVTINSYLRCIRIACLGTPEDYVRCSYESTHWEIFRRSDVEYYPDFVIDFRVLFHKIGYHLKNNVLR